MGRVGHKGQESGFHSLPVLEGVFSPWVTCLPGTKIRQLIRHTRDFLMRFDTRRCPRQATGTRNRTAEVLPVPPGDPPEVSESGEELLRLSEAISTPVPAARVTMVFVQS